MLCHNTYGYSLLFHKVYHEEGEYRQLGFWLEKEQIMETYSAQLQKSWNSTKVIFGINKNYWAKKIPEGAHTLAMRVTRSSKDFEDPSCHIRAALAANLTH